MPVISPDSNVPRTSLNSEPGCIKVVDTFRAAEYFVTAMDLFDDMGMRFWFEKAKAEM
jgi:hypothetical protein